MSYSLNFPIAIVNDDQRGSLVQIDHESTHLNLCASLTLEQLDALIGALQSQRVSLVDWENGFLVL
jgi:hypothetical protein